MTTPQRTETGGPNRTPRSEITSIISVNRKKEPVVLLDLSGSMQWEAAPPDGSLPTRQDVVTEALAILVRRLETEDSEAAAEQASGSDELGGVMAHGFNSSHVDIGDLNSSNLQRKLGKMPWGGGTYIMPAWKAALSDFDEEFGDRDPDEVPVMETLVLTDGEAADWDQFVSVLEKANVKRVFLVAIVGHGEDHDRTVKAYQAAAQKNQVQSKDGKCHVQVVSFDAVTNPDEIADDLITMVL